MYTVRTRNLWIHKLNYDRVQNLYCQLQFYILIVVSRTILSMKAYTLRPFGWCRTFLVWLFGLTATFIGLPFSAWSSRSDKIQVRPLDILLIAKCADEVQQETEARIYERRTLDTHTIRVLILCPGKPKDPLRGYLITRNLKTYLVNQRYEAISYAWGDSKRSRSMMLNNERFAITESLHVALQHLRKENLERRIWIDAICIDQSNEAELNNQVSIMGDIYGSALCVVNWLGPEGVNTARGMKALRFLFGDEDLTVPWLGHKSKLWRAGLNDILERDYWKRIWVVQENALASRVTLQVGSEVLKWSSGLMTYKAICRIKFAVISPAWEAAGLQDVNVRPLLEILEQNMMMTRRNMNKPCRQVTILDMAFDMRYRKARDRRDMLFALRNMLPEEVRKYMVVDYNKPVDELYVEFFREVERAYKQELEFVEISENERKDKMEAQDRYLSGW